MGIVPIIFFVNEIVAYKTLIDLAKLQNLFQTLSFYYENVLILWNYAAAKSYLKELKLICDIVKLM